MRFNRQLFICSYLGLFLFFNTICFADARFEKDLALAKTGNADAQRSVGTMYCYGINTPVNYLEAFKWYKKAAEQGSDYAQSGLGLMYIKGQGVLTDYIQAYVWLNCAKALGNKIASNNLDIIVDKMTPQQIAEGQKLSQVVWKRINKKNKG